MELIGGSALINFGAITGGNGGRGAPPPGATASGGNGGNAGNGVFGKNATNATIMNMTGATITGGNGGAGGTGVAGGLPGTGGFGGVGILGSNLTVVNAGTVSAGTGEPRAIVFTGGVNSLEMQQGWTINGSVVGQSGSTNTLILGGDGTDLNTNPLGSSVSTVFAVPQIGAKYQGFSAFAKTGASTWELTGTPTETTRWTIQQ